MAERLPSLQTLAAIDWSRSATSGKGNTQETLSWTGYINNERYSQEIAPLLWQTSQYIATLHQHLPHGDLQIKNIGTIPSGEYIAFDLEGAIFRHDLPDDEAGHHRL